MANAIDRILGYVSGRIIEKRPSPFSGTLEVWHQNGRYVLHTKNANYSFDTLHKVFQKAFKRTAIKKRKIDNVLILGFGAGSAASILCDELKLSPVITGIEVDPEVIALSEKYFDLGHFQNLEIHIQPAEVFISRHRKRYDLIVHDVFIDKNVPVEVQQPEHLDNLIRLTAVGGIGFYNFLVDNPSHKIQRRELEEHFKKSGVEVCSLNLSSVNRMLVWEHRMK